MNSLSRNIWIALNLVLLALFYAGYSYTEAEQRRAFASHEENARSHLRYLATELEKQLRQKNYQIAEGFIKNWAKEMEHVDEVILTAANGFVLGHYRNEVPSDYVDTYQAQINYAYDSRAVVVLRISNDEIIAYRTRVNAYLLFGFICLTGVLYFMVYALLRLRETGNQLRRENLDRIVAEESLREREQQLALTLYSIGDGIIATDADGCVSHINPVAENLTGWREQDAAGKELPEVFNIVNAVTGRRAENPVDRVLRYGKTVGLANHTVLVSRSGEEYQIADSAAPIKTDDDRVIGAILVFRDVTDEYRMQRDIEAREKFQQQMLDGMLTYLAILDSEGDILFINRAWLQVLGLDFAEVSGKKLFDMDCWSYSSQAREILVADLEKSREQEIMPRDIQFLAADSSPKWVEFHISRIAGEHGQAERLIIEARDITSRKSAEEILQRGQKMEALGKLTGGIAHDFNNMLGVIMGYAEILVSRLEGQPALARYASEIHRSGERGARLTRKLLSFTRNQQAETGIVNINDVIMDELHMLEKTLTPKITLHTRLESDLWLSQMNRGDLEDAILNVCINAMHAMPDGGLLTLSTRNIQLNEADVRTYNLEPGEYIELSIADTGIGMDRQTQSQIFDPFFTTKEDGTGLGLSQVYGFVQGTEGTVKVYSEKGKGSRITFWFPRHDAAIETEQVQEIAQPAKISAGTGVVLVVDDEPGLRTLAQDVLESAGYRVLVAENGEAAMRVLAQEPVDLLLSDVIMPGMDGYMLANKVQQQYPGVKIQMASGFSEERHLELVDESLHEQLLRKPYASAELLKRVTTLLEDRPQTAGHGADEKPAAAGVRLDDLLDWSDDMEIGVPAIDREHKQLHELLRKCHRCVNDGCENGEVRKMLDDMLEYTRVHFMHEETIMRACEYPHLENHRSVHEMLAREVNKHIREYEDGRFSMDELLKLLQQWMLDHNMGMDRAIADYARGREDVIARALDGIADEVANRKTDDGKP